VYRLSVAIVPEIARRLPNGKYRISPTSVGGTFGVVIIAAPPRWSVIM
jgi:hypothetical protein